MKFFTLICILVIISTVRAARLLNQSKRCKVSTATDFQQNTCLMNDVETAVVFLSKNKDKTLNLPDLDPMAINSISMGPKEFGYVLGTNTTMNNMLLHGLSNYKSTNFYGKLSSPVNFEAHVIGRINQMYITGDYEYSGKIFDVDVSGSGKSNSTLNGVTIHATIFGQRKIIRKKEYLDIVNVNLDIGIEGMAISAANLFDDNVAFSEAATALFNQNSGLIYVLIKPFFEGAIAPSIQNFVSVIMESVPFDDIFQVTNKVTDKCESKNNDDDDKKDD